MDDKSFKTGTKLFFHYLRMMEEIAKKPGEIDMEDFKIHFQFQVDHDCFSFGNKTLNEVARKCMLKNCK